MPINRRGRYTKRKPIRRKKRSTALTIAKKSYTLAKKLVSAQSAHFVEVQDADMFGIAGTPAVNGGLHITAVPRGDGVTDRSGNEINVNSILVDGVCQVNGTGQSNQIHVALCRYTQQVTDEVTITYPAIYKTTTSRANGGLFYMFRSATLDGTSPNVKEFQVLAHRLITVNTTGTPIKKFRMYHKFKKPMQVKYNGSAATDIERNGMFLVWCCDGGGVPSANTVPNCAIATRLRFYP